jgi:formate dehydrogenase iron-sulfur subunit
MARAVLVDTTKCIGCRACQVACKQWNELPAEPAHAMLEGTYQNQRELSPRTWTLVHFTEQRVGDRLRWLFAKYQCMHCSNPPCVAVCPTGALSKEGEVTYLDETRCIGDRYCVNACPFEAIRFDEDKGIVQKCTLCVDRLAADQPPACVKACPAGALTWDERPLQVAAARERVAALQAAGVEGARTYGETELGGLHFLYVLQDRPATYGLPDPPAEQPIQVGRHVGNWATGAALFGLGLLPLWWLLRRRQEQAGASPAETSGRA